MLRISVCHVNWQAEAMAERKGITLPQEFLTAAAQGGLRQSVLLQYALLQVGMDHHSQCPALAAACIVLLQTNL